MVQKQALLFLNFPVIVSFNKQIFPKSASKAKSQNTLSELEPIEGVWRRWRSVCFWPFFQHPYDFTYILKHPIYCGRSKTLFTILSSSHERLCKACFFFQRFGTSVFVRMHSIRLHRLKIRDLASFQYHVQQFVLSNQQSQLAN